MSATPLTLFGKSFWYSSCSFRPIVLKFHMIRSSSKNVQMVSAQYLVKELMDLDHTLHTY